MANTELILKECPNCGQEQQTNYSFCPNCGQANFKENDLKSFTSHFLSDYFTFDSKIFRSIQPLFTKPGLLTLEFLEGKRIKYIPPLRLFIFSSIIFFLLLNLLDISSSNSSMSLDAEEQAWESFFSSWLPKLFFILSPLFALLLSLFFKKEKGSYLVHFLFSLHFHSTIFLTGIIYTIVSWIFFQLNWQNLNEILLIVSLVYLAAYLFKGLRKVYKEKRAKIFYKIFLLSILYGIILTLSAILLTLFLL